MLVKKMLTTYSMYIASHTFFPAMPTSYSPNMIFLMVVCCPRFSHAQVVVSFCIHSFSSDDDLTNIKSLF